MKWLFALLAAMGILVILGAGIVTPTGTFDGASPVNVRGVVIDEDTGKPIEGAHIEFRFGPAEPTNAEGFSANDGTFVLFLADWSFYGYEYFFLWAKTYYYQFCLQVSADGYDEIVTEYEGIPRDVHYVNADNIDVGRVSLNPSAAAPTE